MTAVFNALCALYCSCYGFPFKRHWLHAGFSPQAAGLCMEWIIWIFSWTNKHIKQRREQRRAHFTLEPFLVLRINSYRKWFWIWAKDVSVYHFHAAAGCHYSVNRCFMWEHSFCNSVFKHIFAHVLLKWRRLHMVYQTWSKLHLSELLLGDQMDELRYWGEYAWMFLW